MGYAHRFDPAALVLGPTGLAYDKATDTLYVASTADNKIFAVSHAGKTTSLGSTTGIATVLSGTPRFNFAGVDDVPNTISVYFLP
ncbi:MAG TPA: hypothetical protein VNO18_04130 [Xanthobacteraceae bacterium]|jgi:hypothetical protein|nr:hypothetical protein [Xanthobacteraceae bacterium]